MFNTSLWVGYLVMTPWRRLLPCFFLYFVDDAVGWKVMVGTEDLICFVVDCFSNMVVKGSHGWSTIDPCTNKKLMKRGIHGNKSSSE
jgi:hypothetical protein